MFYNLNLDLKSFASTPRIKTLPSETTKSGSNSQRRQLFYSKSKITNDFDEYQIKKSPTLEKITNKLIDYEQNRHSSLEQKSQKFKKLQNFTLHEQSLAQTELPTSKSQNSKKNFSINETHDIYGLFGVKQKEPKLFEGQAHLYLLCREVIDNFENELSKLEDCRNTPKNLQLQQSKYEFLSLNFHILMNIKVMTEKLLENKTDRNEIENIIEQIIIDSQRIKNLNFQFQTNYLFAKLIIIYKNPFLAISLLKNAKRMVDFEEFIQKKSKAYKCLGECYLHLNPRLSLLYFTKYLMCAWKCDNKEAEQTAYDLLGKYYYYQGDIKKAKIFHQKAVDGDLENEDSAVRKLGIAKLLNGSIGRVKRVNQILTIEEPEYRVSSDDEPLDVQFKEKISEQPPEKKLQKYALREMPKYYKDEKRKYQQFIQGNDNIRQKIYVFKSRIMNGNEVDLKKLKGVSTKSQTYLGEIKDKLFFQHLTPNRDIAQYQYLELIRGGKYSKKSEELRCYFEKNEMKNINSKLSKYINKIKFILQWITQKQQQLGGPKSNQRRLGCLN